MRDGAAVAGAGMAESASKLKTCFVIGPFGEDGSPIRRWSDALLKDVIKPLADEFGYVARRSIDDERQRDITRDIVANLLQADLVIADLTSANANVYYELAIRHAIERPFIHIIQDKQKPPFDVGTLAVLSLPAVKKWGATLPDPKKSVEKLRPSFAAVADNTASFTSILSGEQVGKIFDEAIARMKAERAALDKPTPEQASRLPDHMKKAIYKYVTGAPLYYKTFDYDIELEHHADGQVTYHMDVTFEQVNVTDHRQQVVNKYPTPTEGFELKAVVVNGQDIDLSAPSLYREDAITLEHYIPVGGSVTFKVVLSKTFPEHDHDLFTAYLFPAEAFRFRVKNRSPGTLRAWLEMLNSQEAPVQRAEDGALVWKAGDPIMPNQGVRLSWRPQREKLR